MTIRAASVAERPLLRDTEQSAGEAFRDTGVAAIADDEPPQVDDLARYRARGHAWGAVDEDDRTVAYLIAEPVEGNWHRSRVGAARHPPMGSRAGPGRMAAPGKVVETFTLWLEAATRGALKPEGRAAGVAATSPARGASAPELGGGRRRSEPGVEMPRATTPRPGARRRP
jgi:hypothetical protein